jgi:glycosyltransferase involved in cell wall biosynthesis
MRNPAQQNCVRDTGKSLLLSVLMPVYNPLPEYLQAALDSVLYQTYPYWELCIADDASTDPQIYSLLERCCSGNNQIKVIFRRENGNVCAASNSALELCSGDFIALMDHDDLLAPDALEHIALEIMSHPDVAVIYADEDQIAPDGSRYSPHRKWDWNGEWILAQNFINHPAVFENSLLREVGGFRLGLEGSQDHDLILRCALRVHPDKIRHIPKILYHWRHFDGSGSFSDRNLARCEEARRRCAGDFLAAKGINASVSTGPDGMNVIRYALPPDPPSVTCAVATENSIQETLCSLKDLFARTSYADVEILLVRDNESEETDTALGTEYSGRADVKLLRVHHAFGGFGAWTAAAKAAKGEFIVFLREGLQPLTKDWLEVLLGYGVQSETGAVGPKILTQSDAHESWKPQAAHWSDTLADGCLLISKAKFLQIESSSPYSRNNRELCRKLSSAGYRNIYTPLAQFSKQ